MVKPIPPLSVSSEWPPVNYVDPEIRSHANLLAITVTFTTVMVIITSMRLYVRLFMLRTPGWDDFFNFAAAVFSIGLCITMNLSMNYGWGRLNRPSWPILTFSRQAYMGSAAAGKTYPTDNSKADFNLKWFQVSELVGDRGLPRWNSSALFAGSNALQFQWCVQNQYIVLITCAKLSALCTYLRVSQGLKKLRVFIFITIGIIASFGIGPSFLALTCLTSFSNSPCHHLRVPVSDTARRCQRLTLLDPSTFTGPALPAKAVPTKTTAC
jgi:hypothetical protein